jgi:hypothetical protein
MSDLLDVLQSLPDGVTSRPAGADVVVADVARGHCALARQRRRRIAFSTVAVAGAAAVVAGAGQLTQTGGSAPPVAKSSRATVQAPRLRLTAYTGPQPAGFKVRTVPAGWHVIWSNKNSFVVAPPGPDGAVTKTNPANKRVVSYVGRIAVMLQDASQLPGDSPVTKVTINGKKGVLGLADSGNSTDRAAWLIFPDGAGHSVLVQVPTSLHLTNDQIVRFAQGITVTKAAMAGVG